LSELSTIKDLLQSLIKTRKLIRMYPENNPMYIKAVNDMYEKFERAFQQTSGDIAFQIRQYEILFQDEQVYHNPEKSDNLALFFFKDGIRELKFLKGLGKEELEEFLKILCLDEKELVDDDIVTLMWERDFQNIKYIVDESTLTEDEEYELRATEALMENVTSEEVLLRAYRDALTSETARVPQIVPVEEEDLKALIKEFEKDADPKLPKLVYILSEIIYQGLDKKEFEEFSFIAKSLLEYAIKIGDFESAINIIELVKKAIDDRDIIEGAKVHLKKIIEHAGSTAIIKTLGEIIDRIEIEEKTILTYLGHLDKNAIQPLIEVLGELKTIKARKIIIDGLALLGRRDMQSLIKGLSDERWYVVRNIVYILRLIGDRRAVEYLLKTIRHPDMRVRREVIKTLGELKAPQAVTILKDHLNDPDPQIRIATVRALGSIHTEAAKRLLLQRINTKDFLHRTLEEKKEYFEVLSSWRDEEVTDFLVKTLKRNTLFNRSKNFENRACAAYALGLMGSKEHLNILKKYIDSGNPLLREYVRNAITRISGTRMER
jgi:hypothetical protein